MIIKLSRGFMKPLLFTLLVTFCCCNSRPNERIFTEYKLPISSEQDIMYLRAIIDEDKLYGYNKHTNGIDIISIDSTLETPAQQLILFDKEGPNRQRMPENMFYYNGDLYLLDVYDMLNKINLNTLEKEKYQLSFEKNGEILMPGRGVSFNPPKTLTQFEQYICLPLYKSGHKTDEDYYDSLYIAKINFDNYQFELLSFAYPPEFKEYYWPVHDNHYVQQIGKDQYVIAFKGLAALFLTNTDGSLTKVEHVIESYGLAELSKPAPKTITESEVQKNSLYMNGNQYFSPIYFNSQKECLYRLAKGKTDDDGFNQTKNLHLFKYNLDLEIIDYVAVPEGLLPRFIVGDKGIYFQHSTSTSESEDVFRLTQVENF